MANKQSGVKGNPAAKRMSNPKRKAKRERAWLRAQKRKAENIRAAQAAFEANEEYRKAGQLTPYQQRRADQRVEYEARKANAHANGGGINRVTW